MRMSDLIMMGPTRAIRQGICNYENEKQTLHACVHLMRYGLKLLRRAT